MDAEERKRLRSSCIKARNALTVQEREERSRRISEQIYGTVQFKSAKTVMLYKAVKGEVSLRALEELAREDGKRFVYPLCVGKGEMIALLPLG